MRSETLCEKKIGREENSRECFRSNEIRPKKKNTLVSGNSGDEKNLHPRGRNFFYPFSGDILFSSLAFFAFFVFLFAFLACLYSCLFFLLVCILVCFFCLFVCFLKLKIYILIHIRLCGRVSDKKIFIRLISGNKTTFFDLIKNF